MINVLLVVKRYTGHYPLFNEMARLDPERFRVVVCYVGGEDDGKNSMKELAAKIYYLGFSNRQTRMSNVALLRQLGKIMENEKIHVVNCHLHRTTAPGIIAALLAANRPAVISTLHGLGSVGTLRRKVANWLLYKKLFRIVGVSHAVRKDVLESNWGLPEGKVVTIQNGLNLGRFLAGPQQQEARSQVLPGVSGGCWFGTLGRLSPVKNQRRLIEAFRKVVDTHPDSRLLLAGRGELETGLKSLAESLGIGDHVHFLGFRTDVAEILRALDVFVLPSVREGFGLSMLEAMASGLPVIAARVGGIPEIFCERPMGKLIEPTDVDGLAAAMTELAALPTHERRALGENARRRALGEFSAKRMVRQYEQLYEEAWRAWSRQYSGRKGLKRKEEHG